MATKHIEVLKQVFPFTDIEILEEQFKEFKIHNIKDLYLSVIAGVLPYDFQSSLTAYIDNNTETIQSYIESYEKEYELHKLSQKSNSLSSKREEPIKKIIDPIPNNSSSSSSPISLLPVLIVTSEVVPLIEFIEQRSPKYANRLTLSKDRSSCNLWKDISEEMREFINNPSTKLSHKRTALLILAWSLVECGWYLDAKETFEQASLIIVEQNDTELYQFVSGVLFAQEKKNKDKCKDSFNKFIKIIDRLDVQHRQKFECERQRALYWMNKIGIKSSQTTIIPRRFLSPAPLLPIIESYPNSLSSVPKSAENELKQMVGLHKVKKLILEIKSIVDIETRKRNLNKNYTGEPITLNMLFVGNPGTGKTTVARLVARILNEIKFLKTSNFKEITGKELERMSSTDRATFFDSIRGGVLFIDEAYQLNPSTSVGGRDVMNDLLKMAEEWRQDTVFILAGYRDDIQNLIKTNQGLTSRFPKEIVFDDFNEDELRLILIQMMDKECMQAEHNSMIDVLARRLAASNNRRGFGNARDVRNMVQRLKATHASRIATIESITNSKVTDAELSVLTKEDMLGFSELPENSQVLNELNQLIGLSSVKDQFYNLLELVKNNREREENNQRPLEISFHRLFLGNPGTGKTVVAKLYARMLKELGLLSKGELMIVNPSDFIGTKIGESESKTKAILESAKGKVIFIDEAYGLHDYADLHGTTDPYRRAVIDTIVAEIQGTPCEDIVLLMAGYTEQMMKMVNEANPGLSRRMKLDNAFYFDDYSDSDLLQILCNKVNTEGFYIRKSEAQRVITEYISRLRCKVNFGNAGEVQNAMDIAKQRYSNRIQRRDQLINIEPDELVAIDFIPDRSHMETSEELMKQLMGLDQLRKEIETIRALVRQMRREGRDPIPIIAGRMNFLFVGPPGTGKTTAARLMGKVLYELEVLPSDKVVEKSASELQTGYVGQAGTQTRKILDSALGGVLFIDEAYRLNESKHHFGFGREIVDELVSALTEERYRGRIAVIMAGYDNDIAQLIKSNPGLESRFPSKITFPNMSAENAIDMFMSRCEKHRISIPSDKEPFIKTIKELMIMAITTMPNWANGRDVETLFGRTLEQRALRLSQMEDMQSDQSLIIQDFELAFNALMENRVSTQTANDQMDIYNPSSRSFMDYLNHISSPRSPPSNSSSPPYPTATAPRFATATDTYIQEMEVDDPKEKELFDDYLNTLKEKLKEADAIHKRSVEQEIERVRKLQEELRKLKEKKDLEEMKKKIQEEEERRVRIAKLQKMGQCPMGFDWHPEGTGWRCDGGSHFVDNIDL